MYKNKNKLILIILFSVLIFSPGLFNFFASDDWFHLDVSRISNLNEFINFFSFNQTPQSTPFYRPISTQLFFYIFQTIFGLNPLPYHLFIFGLFALNLYLVYRFSLFILKNENKSLIATIIYGFSATNFVRLYFISVEQEILMFTFFLISFLNYINSKKKNQILAFIFFILALMSKETAVVLPFIFFSYDYLINKKINRQLIIYIFVIIFYGYFRFISINSGITSSYIFDFSIKKAFNTLSWYFFWSLGAPELLVDYVSSGYRLLPRFYSDFPNWSKIILPAFLLTLITFMALVAQNIKKIDKVVLFTFLFFLLGLAPVIFLPNHKFILQLTVALLGFSLLIGRLFKNTKFFLFFIISYILLNLFTNLLTFQTHYSVSRSRISERVFDYFSSKYPVEIKGDYILFINDTPNFGAAWGGSKQIAQATSNSDLFKVLYKDHDYKVYFEDYTSVNILSGLPIEISSNQFLLQLR